MNTNLFLVSWDHLGLESCVNITAMEKEATWAALQDKKTASLASLVNSVILRARANSQRHYEVYTVNIEDSVTEQDIRSMFESSPQTMADLIRDRGNQIYSDRIDRSSIKIV